jgi:branched-chain amino acid transport system permease protein
VRPRGLWWVGVGVVALALPQVLPLYFTHLVLLTMIYGLSAMSLDVLAGYTGLTSFGHATYFGTAAYTVGILTTQHHLPPALAAGAGVGAAVLLAAAYGLLATRAVGVYFLIITLALGMGTWGLAYRWSSVTGGDNGLPGIPPLDLGLPWSMAEPRNLYYLVLAVFCVAAFLLYRLVHSPFGLTLRGIRESEGRMRMLGYNTWLHRYVAFVVAGGFAGVAGVLYAFYNRFVSPPDLHLAASAEAVLMVILGGAGTLFGPLAGAGIVVFLRNLVSAYTQRWMLILGVVFVLTVLYAPQGVAGGARALWARWRGHAPAPRPQAEPRKEPVAEP